MLTERTTALWAVYGHFVYFDRRTSWTANIFCNILHFLPLYYLLPANILSLIFAQISAGRVLWQATSNLTLICYTKVMFRCRRLQKNKSYGQWLHQNPWSTGKPSPWSTDSQCRWTFLHFGLTWCRPAIECEWMDFHSLENGRKW